MKVAIRQVAFVGLVSQLLVVSGCYRSAVALRGAMTDYKKSDVIQVGFEPGSKLVVRNEAGAVRIASDDGADCRVGAKVYVHAPTKREAREIGAQVQVAAEPNNGTVLVTVKKPPMSQEHRFVSVDLDILVPHRTHVDCETEFGQIRLTGIEGDVKAATQFGSVICEDTQGALDLRTEFGRVTGRKIVSDHLVARTEFGSVDISCGASCPGEMEAEVRTDWGKVRFQAPPDYRGALHLESDSSTVRSALPVTAQGEISRHKIVGTSGSGQGSLRLSSDRGSVRLRSSPKE